MPKNTGRISGIRTYPEQPQAIDLEQEWDFVELRKIKQNYSNLTKTHQPKEIHMIISERALLVAAMTYLGIQDYEVSEVIEDITNNNGDKSKIIGLVLSGK